MWANAVRSSALPASSEAVLPTETARSHVNVGEVRNAAVDHGVGASASDAEVLTVKSIA